MLTVFRKHSKSWLIKVVFGVIVLVFIFWGGYAYRSRQETQMARIGDHYISVLEYNEAYNQMLENYRRQLGKAFSEDLVKELGVKRQVMEMLINTYLVNKAAAEMGLAAGTKEIQQKVLAYPIFLTDGQFDQNRYEAILRQYRMRPETFEQQIGQEISAQKVEEFIRRQAVVTDEEVLADFQLNYSMVQLAYSVFDPKSFEDKVTVDEKGMEAFFQGHQDRYREPEKRQFVMVVFKPDAYMNDVKVTEDEMHQYYEDHGAEYHRGAEVRARHILFAVKEDAPEEEVSKVRAQALQVLDEARKGKDFTELAKKYSQDPSVAKNGGDLGTFSQGQMVPAFEEAAFALKPGEISNLVRTPFGFHIIKVDEVHPERTTPFEEARKDIESILKRQKGKDIAFGKARRFLDLAYARRELEKFAGEQGLPMLGEGVWVSQKDALPGSDTPNAEIMKKLFALQEKDVSDILDTAQGYVIAQVKGIQAPQVPPFDQVKDRVEKDYRAEQARSLAGEKAAELLAAGVKSNNLESAANALKVNVRTSDWFSRQEPDKELKLLRGESLNAMFSLSADHPFPDSPLELGNRFIVCQFLGRKAPEGGVEKERAAIVKRLLRDKQNMIWEAWLQEQREKSKVELYREL